MPQRRRVSSRAAMRTQKVPTSFHLFSKLPPEVRQQIWTISISVGTVVPLRWRATLRQFRSPQNVPVLLHVNSEARAIALKHFTLSFAPSPEFARTYFNFELDYLLLEWRSLVARGGQPSRLRRKLRDEEAARVRKLIFAEGDLVVIAGDEMQELVRFRGLEVVYVLCEDTLQDRGMLGKDEVRALGPAMIAEGEEKWPQLRCSRMAGGGDCSRHWFFYEWNQRAEREKGMALSWHIALGQCLIATLTGEDYDDGQPDHQDVWGLNTVKYRRSAFW